MVTSASRAQTDSVTSSVGLPAGEAYGKDGEDERSCSDLLSAAGLREGHHATVLGLPLIQSMPTDQLDKSG